MRVRDQLHIDGQWAAPKGRKSIDVINASTEEVTGHVLGRFGLGEFLEYKSAQLKRQAKP